MAANQEPLQNSTFATRAQAAEPNEKPARASETKAVDDESGSVENKSVTAKKTTRKRAAKKS